MYAADMELVMQVRACRQARATHETYDFALGDAFARADCLTESREVRIQRRIPVRMAQDDDIAVAALVADKSDMAVSGGSDSSAARSTVVNALVRTPGSEYRMEPRIRES